MTGGACCRVGDGGRRRLGGPYEWLSVTEGGSAGRDRRFVDASTVAMFTKALGLRMSTHSPTDSRRNRASLTRVRDF